MQVALFNDRPSSAPLAARFPEERILAKLHALDSRARRKGLAGLEHGRNPLIDIGMEFNSRGHATKNSYGLFHLSWLAGAHPEWAGSVTGELAQIKERIRAAHGKPLKFLIWAGMGGSAEDKSAYNACGLLGKGPRCYVLDSTDPAKLKAILDDIARRSAGSLAGALRSSLVVGMAMGMTSYEPVVNLEKLAILYDKLQVDSRPNFVYMTLPDSLLDQFAKARGYTRIELQLDGGNSTAGRHSAPLTKGSLYPLGLAGTDLHDWMQGTQLGEEEIHSAWQLSSFIHEQGLAGRDKVTLAPSRSLAGLALWTKQNFEESLGKSEALGLKIVIGEKLRTAYYRSPKDAAQDRIFLAVQRKGDPPEDRDKLQVLRRAGYPVAILRMPASAPVSRYQQFIHYVVFGVGWLRRMNFVTQPSVELYKAITKPIYDAAVKAGGIEKTSEWRSMLATSNQAKWRGGISLRWDRLPGATVPDGKDAAAVYAGLLKVMAKDRAIEYGELTWFGDTRYSRGGQAARKVLDRAAERVFRSALKMPVDVYEGPAMNHSYHEMIIGHGRCFSTVLLSEKSEKIPAAGYTADYHRSQFLATQMALAQRGRAVVSIMVKDTEEGSLRALDDFFKEVASRMLRSS